MPKSSKCKTVFFQTLLALVLISIIVVLICDAVFLILQIDKSIRDRNVALDLKAKTGYITIQDTRTYKKLQPLDSLKYNEELKMNFKTFEDLKEDHFYENYYEIDEIDEEYYGYGEPDTESIYFNETDQTVLTDKNPVSLNNTNGEKQNNVFQTLYKILSFK